MFNISSYDNENYDENDFFSINDINDSFNNNFIHIFPQNNSLINNSSYEDDNINDIFKFKKDNSQFIPINEHHLDISIINEEKSTKDKTNNEKQPDFYSIDKINENLLNNTIKNKFNKGNIEKSNEYYFLKEKTKRRILEDDCWCYNRKTKKK